MLFIYSMIAGSLIFLIYLLLEMTGCRSYVSVISGTFPDSSFPQEIIIVLAITYILFYFLLYFYYPALHHKSSSYILLLLLRNYHFRILNLCRNNLLWNCQCADYVIEVIVPDSFQIRLVKRLCGTNFTCTILINVTQHCFICIVEMGGLQCGTDRFERVDVRVQRWIRTARSEYRWRHHLAGLRS